MASVAWAVLVVSLVIVQQALATEHCLQTFTCVNCHTLQICLPQTVSNQKNSTTLVDCAGTRMPYCDNTIGSCSSTPSPSCMPKDNFTCLSDGYFPDPYDNRAFHICMNLIPTSYRCESYQPNYYVYDVVLYRCVQDAITNYNCAGKSVVKSPHPADSNLFTLCINGTATLQDRCPGNNEMDENSQTCVSVCQTPGLQPDLDNCTMYFQCVQQNGGYVKSHENCPLEQAFNPITLECGDDHSHCTRPPTPNTTTSSYSTITTYSTTPLSLPDTSSLIPMLLSTDAISDMKQSASTK